MVYELMAAVAIGIAGIAAGWLLCSWHTEMGNFYIRTTDPDPTLGTDIDLGTTLLYYNSETNRLFMRDSRCSTHEYTVWNLYMSQEEYMREVYGYKLDHKMVYNFMTEQVELTRQYAILADGFNKLIARKNELDEPRDADQAG